MRRRTSPLLVDYEGRQARLQDLVAELDLAFHPDALAVGCQGQLHPVHDLGHPQDFSDFRSHLGGVAVDRLLADQDQVGIRFRLRMTAASVKAVAQVSAPANLRSLTRIARSAPSSRQRMRADQAWGGPMLTATISMSGLAALSRTA